MEKKVINWHGKKFYLLGKDKEGEKYWLQAPSWDCGWYWGFGYIEVLSNKKKPELSKDIKLHTHFDSLFLNDKSVYAKDLFDSFFVETTLEGNEVYQLIDYMMSFYNLKNTAAILSCGDSHQTEKAKIDVLKNEDLANYINKTLLPAIFERIDKLLGENYEKEIL